MNVRICSIEELQQTGRVTKWITELRDELTVLKTKESIVVFSSICPHFGGEFKFSPRNGQVVCKWHGWRFDIESNKCLNYKTKTKLRHYPYCISEDTNKAKHIEVMTDESN